MDKIFIKNLKINTLIGIYPQEQHQSQALIFDFVFYCDFNPVFKSQAIEDTLNYDAISQSVYQFCNSKHFGLLETLTFYLFEHLFTHFSALKKIKIRIRKPQAIEPALAAIESIRSREQILPSPCKKALD